MGGQFANIWRWVWKFCHNSWNFFSDIIKTAQILLEHNGKWNKKASQKLHSTFFLKKLLWHHFLTHPPHATPLASHFFPPKRRLDDVMRLSSSHRDSPEWNLKTFCKIYEFASIRTRIFHFFLFWKAISKQFCEKNLITGTKFFFKNFSAQPQKQTKCRVCG